jgi:predicted ATPase/DNA-binding XRE family transcriptional regulator
MSDSTHIGQWIRRRRKEIDTTQRALAASAGITTDYLRRIESGARWPSLDRARSLAAALKLNAVETDSFLLMVRTRRPSRRSTVFMPHYADEFIGRNEEIARIREALTITRCRVLTITGIAGVGKTRLGQHMAWLLRDSFYGGVFYFEFEEAVSPEKFVIRLSKELALEAPAPDAPPDAALEPIIEALQSSPVLLVLDSVENLRRCCAVITALLERIPRLRLLQTSQQAVEMKDEWLVALRGLSYPQTDDVPNALEFDAPRLLLERTARYAAGAAQTAPDAAAILRICRLVDGHPLALEMVAEWQQYVSFNLIADELEHGSDLLRTEVRNMPDRHRSIGQAIQAMFDQLPADTVAAAARLAVIEGSFDHHAASEVAGVSLAMIESLRRASLIEGDGVNRLRLHPLIRQYLTRQLDTLPDVRRSAEHAHVEHYLRQLRRSFDLPLMPQHDLAVHIEREYPNIRAACLRAVASGDWAELEQITAQIWGFFTTTNRHEEALEFFRAIPGLMPDTASYTNRIEAELLRLAMEIWFLVLKGELPGARLSAQALLALSQDFAPRSPRWQLYLDTFRALAYYYLRETGTAVALFYRALEACEEQGGFLFMPYITHFLGFTDLAQRQWNQALAHFERTLVQTVHYGITWLTPYSRRAIGLALLRRGDVSQAYPHLQAAASAFRAHRDDIGLASALTNIAEVHNERGAYAEAGRHLLEALQLIQDTRKLGTLMEAMTEVALLYFVTGRHDRAVEVAQMVSRNPALMRDSEERAWRVRDRVCAGIPPIELKLAHARAMTLDLPAVLARTLEELPALLADLTAGLTT